MYYHTNDKKKNIVTLDWTGMSYPKGRHNVFNLHECYIYLNVIAKRSSAGIALRQLVFCLAINGLSVLRISSKHLIDIRKYEKNRFSYFKRSGTKL